MRIVPRIVLILSAGVAACAAPQPIATRYSLSPEEQTKCGDYARGLAREEDSIVNRQNQRDMWRVRLEQCREQLVQQRESALSQDLKLGLASMVCLGLKRVQELSAIRKDEDLRRQHGERVTRQSPPVSEDTYQSLYMYSLQRLANRGDPYGCGTVEVIDTGECMQATMEHATDRPSSCDLAYVGSAIQAFKADAAAHSQPTSAQQ